MKPDVLVIQGPTASGKTKTGILLAAALQGEIISADSMQIYRGMNIGTAKPTVDEMMGIAHHMIDIVDPAEDYSVSRYVSEADACAQDIIARGKLPILLGGTGLYIDTFIRGQQFDSLPEDKQLRLALEGAYLADGGAALWQELGRVDPTSAARLHQNDKRRVVRALEVYRLSGVPISVHQARTKLILPRYRACKITLSANKRADLYARIDARVDQMLELGLLGEVKALQAQDLPKSATALQAIGYKEIIRALAGDCTMDDAISQIKQESRRYAKRQLSWFRQDEAAQFLLWDRTPCPETLAAQAMDIWHRA